ncbi:MAG: hypothetical protein NTW72_11940 [Gemmatimonadetes bacterium]|nr:hypothetical protein [Gemmatimonadota bacterium]
MNDDSSLAAAEDVPLAQPSRATRLLAVGVLVVVALAGVIGGIALDRTVLRQHQWEGRLARGTEFKKRFPNGGAPRGGPGGGPGDWGRGATVRP